MKKFWVSSIVFIVILVTFILQITLFNTVTLFGVSANVCIIFVASLGLMCGENIGGIVGCVFGVFSDVIIGKAFGIYTLIYMIIGYIAGRLSNMFSKDNKSSVVAISLIATLIFELSIYLSKFVLYNYDFSIIFIIKELLFKGLYSVVLSAILFNKICGLAEIINRSKESYYLL